jgi:hypothetical protein
MDNKFLADLQVTAEELSELQSSERPFGLLTERQKKILNAATQAGCSHFWSDGRWVLIKPRNGCCWGSYTYRLHPDLTLPEPPQRPSDPRKPFKWQIDGQEVWCCPVFVERRRMYFKDPHSQPTTMMIMHAPSFSGWLGCMEADEDGFPIDRLWGNDISMALPVHHGSSSSRIDFVCFKVKEVDGERN